MTAAPFRVQGIHVGLFATEHASKARRMTFVGGFLAVLMVTFVAIDLRHVDTLVTFVSREAFSTVFLIVGIVIARRGLRRSRRLQAIAAAAQLEPVAVWCLKDKVLYPLDPKAPRQKLSIVLNASEQTLIRQKPPAPIAVPQEPLP